MHVLGVGCFPPALFGDSPDSQGPRDQLINKPIAFQSVAPPARQDQIILAVGATSRAGDDMVNRAGVLSDPATAVATTCVDGQKVQP